MIIPIELRFKADKDTRLAVSTNKTIKSHDINSVEFHIAIEGLELTDNHTAKILSIFHSSKSQVNTDCEIVDGKIIYKPDTKLISMYETVTNYVYVYYNDKSLDVCEFNYTVKLSKIDETALEVKEVYDKSYADLLADFEQALNDYKDSLPQVDSVRAEIDVILNQFNVDSQAKLNQYDADAQQAIADNQNRFDLAESVRNEAEESRVEAETQRESAESERVRAEVERKANEESRELAEDERGNAEVIRLANEVDRVNAENVRAGFYDGFDGRLSGLESERTVLRNNLVNGGFDSSTNGWRSAMSTSTVSEGFVEVTATKQYGGIAQNQQTTKYNGRVLYMCSMVKAKSSLVNIVSNSDPGVVSVFHSGEGDWERLSMIQNQPTDATRLRVEVRDNAVSPIESFQVKYVAAIDLTATFGTGNEPTKEEMDELIKITGYFDEITLAQKQVLKWQLNLMRQNRNAIIALGGTII